MWYFKCNLLLFNRGIQWDGERQRQRKRERKRKVEKEKVAYRETKKET